MKLDSMEFFIGYLTTLLTARLSSIGVIGDREMKSKIFSWVYLTFTLYLGYRKSEGEKKVNYEVILSRIRTRAQAQRLIHESRSLLA